MTSQDEGFSLLELIVAIGVLSLAVIPMIGSQNTSIRHIAMIEEKALASMVAEDMVATFVGQEFASAPGKQQGETTQGGLDFNWTANIVKVPGTRMLSVTVTVSSIRDSRSLVRLTGFRKDA